jgi:hypothetical protein
MRRDENRLLAELANIGSADDAALWAHRNLRAKNDLTAADAQRVEEAFLARLATLPAGAGEPVQQNPTKEAPCVHIRARQTIGRTPR